MTDIVKGDKQITLQPLSPAQKLKKHNKLYAVSGTLIASLFAVPALGLSDPQIELATQAGVALLGLIITHLVQEFPDLTKMIDVVEDLLERIEEQKQ